MLPSPAEVSYWTRGVLTLPSPAVQVTWKRKAGQKVKRLGHPTPAKSGHRFRRGVCHRTKRSAGRIVGST